MADLESKTLKIWYGDPYNTENNPYWTLTGVDFGPDPGNWTDTYWIGIGNNNNFRIPKIQWRYFLYDRDLLPDLSRCAWESLKVFLRAAVPERNPVPGAVIAIQSFGDFLGSTLTAMSW